MYVVVALGSSSRSGRGGELASVRHKEKTSYCGYVLKPAILSTKGNGRLAQQFSDLAVHKNHWQEGVQ